MKTISAREAKNSFGFLLDTARQEPVLVEKHGRPVVVVVSIEKYDQMLSKIEKNNKNENHDDK